ncbi:MAG: serine/threonine protein kinase, partial [Myxococcales bacterium]|nr:serine/threonine protein kinase [Myxococcales bacterium]
DGTYPKLIDFGVSKGFTEGERITRTGAVVGTPEYMSPEQARGLREIGPASDLWAVGVLLYEGLTGHTPFESENPGDVLIVIATEDVPPLAERRPDLPPVLVEIIDKALQKKPENRFTDARAMRDALHVVMQSGAEIDGGPNGRASFGPAPGSGLIRVLSAPPVPPPSFPSSPELALPPSPRLPRESRGGVKTPTTEDHVVEMLDVSRPAARSERGRRWPAVLVALVILAAGAASAFFALDGRAYLARAGLLGGGDEDGAASGQLRPGLDVAALTHPMDRAAETTTAVAFDPPPENGVVAPQSETIDVPSPPDPPAEVDELSGSPVAAPEPEPEAEAAPAPSPRGRRVVRRRRRRPTAP